MNEENPSVAPKPSFRTLIVDDHVSSAKILGTLFNKLGQDQVELAHCGKEAIEKARLFKPNVMVLDLMLGDISGFEVARTIRQDTELANTLLIALTGNDSTEDRQKSTEAGFHLHRVKPFGVELVKEIIELFKEFK